MVDVNGCVYVCLEVSRIWQMMQVKGLDKFCEVAIGKPDAGQVIIDCGLGATSGADQNHVPISHEDEVVSEVAQLGPRTHISLGNFPQKSLPYILKELEQALFDKPQESINQIDTGFQFTVSYNWDCSPGSGKTQGIDHILDVQSLEAERLGTNSPMKEGKHGWLR